MVLFPLAIASCLLLSSGLVSADAALNKPHAVHLAERAKTTDLDDPVLYAPINATCPDYALIRSASGLSNNETDFINDRRALVNESLLDYFNRVDLDDFNPDEFFANVTPIIGLAFSGGGYRAMLSGAGQLSALDNRTVNSTDTGGIGGILQSATYLVGLSGGNWLVGSVALNDYPTIPQLQGSKSVWDLEDSIFNPGGIDLFETADYYYDLNEAVRAKQDAGFNISLTDIWGRALSQQFVNLTDGGYNFSWSDIQTLPSFIDRAIPFPIVVADGRAPGTQIISLNSTVFEISPFEFGTWDPDLYGFVPTRYLGSDVNDGVPTNETCVENFDNGGFIMGTSSSLFNAFLLEINSTGLSGILYDLAYDILGDLDEDYNDISIFFPNPFKGFSGAANSTIANSEDLFLVDGGEDDQNVPFYPLVQPERNVDVIFAFDNSADTDYYWPNGASLAATYQRQFGSQGNGTIFPSAPDNVTFLNLGLGDHPTWFGCNSSNLTGQAPLIVYTSNHPYSFLSNTSTFKMSYEEDEVAGMIQNGYNVATQANGTIDSDWPACVACAIIHREMERRNQTPTTQCQQCLDKYCWNGTLDTTPPNSTILQPTPVLAAADSAGTAGILQESSVSFTGSLTASDATVSSTSATASASSSASKKNAASATIAPPHDFWSLTIFGLILAPLIPLVTL